MPHLALPRTSSGQLGRTLAIVVSRHVGALALIAAGVFVLVSDLRPSVSGDAGLIAGPYAYLLASSTDLGPSHRADAQLTAALRDSMRPDALFGWAGDNGLAVRWRPGTRWAAVVVHLDIECQRGQ